MPAVLYPFPRLFGDLNLSLEEVVVDNSRVPETYINRDARLVSALEFHKESWREMQLSFSVDIPLQEVRSKDIDEDKLRLLLRLNCDATNLRVTETPDIRQVPANVRIAVRRECVSESFTLDAFLVEADDAGVPRILKESLGWKVVLESTPVRANNLPGRSKNREIIDIRWIDFDSTQHSIQQLKDAKTEAYYLDVSSKPILYLNKSLPGYFVLLGNRRAASKAESALRELEYRRLGLAAFLAMAYQALGELRRDDDDEIIIPSDWRAEILRRVSREMFPGDSDDAALRKILELKESDSQAGNLNSLLQIAINKILGASNTLKKHLTGMLESA